MNASGTAESKFMTAEDVAAIMETSRATAYRLIQKMNIELQEQGKLVVRGKVPKRYFEQKVIL